MTTLKVYGRPFYKDGLLINPYSDLTVKRNFTFYSNYRYAVNYVSDSPIKYSPYFKDKESIAQEGLNCFRRTVLFADTSDLIPMANLSPFNLDIYERAKNSHSLDHVTSWVSAEGTIFLLNEPYVTDDYYHELLHENYLVYIPIPRDLSPYCGFWDPSPSANPRTSSYLICDRRDIHDLQKVYLKLHLASVGFYDPKSKLPPRWNSLKEIKYV